MTDPRLSQSGVWAETRYALHVEGATEASLERVDALVAALVAERDRTYHHWCHPTQRDLDGCACGAQQRHNRLSDALGLERERVQ